MTPCTGVFARRRQYAANFLPDQSWQGHDRNDDKRHLHTKRQQVPETVTHIFTMLIGVCGVNQSAITKVAMSATWQRSVDREATG